MIKIIMPDLYRVKTPMPENPLKYLNSYIIKSEGLNLIIDTGMNREESLDAMKLGLDELNIDLLKTDIFLTHLHIDHSGLVPDLLTDRTNIYFSLREILSIRKFSDLELFKNNLIDDALLNGFPEIEIQDAIGDFFEHIGAASLPSAVNTSPKFNLTLVEDRDVIKVGDFTLVCIATPGHSEGHMCLFEPEKKILFSGDHILGKISPAIPGGSDNKGNPLMEYLTSLDKVYDLEVDLVLPGHGAPFKNHKNRIRELKNHHEHRLGEIINILGKGPQHAFKIASQMDWDVEGKWGIFPAEQKWFAMDEANAHLRYLEEKKIILKQKEKDIYFYQLVAT